MTPHTLVAEYQISEEHTASVLISILKVKAPCSSGMLTHGVGPEGRTSGCVNVISAARISEQDAAVLVATGRVVPIRDQILCSLWAVTLLPAL